MPTSSQSDSVPSARLAPLAQLGTELHANSTETAVWLALEQTLSDFFGYSLFTVLAFSKQGGVTSLYSTNTDLHPLGIRKESPAADYDRDNVGNSISTTLPRSMGPAGLGGQQYLAWLRARGRKGSIWKLGATLAEAELVSYCAATYLRLKSLDLTILIDIKARL
ncbi:hypothetical protein PENARI_c006G01939 [Penicillium arizonense]|uniref:Uncharacterized protein n=1 Tax=Penicillium arizonense TaxID=1835702 RepID=A0A1F5LN22_PENAI|nr:hypothetical protein PENARI_c006G01939 [Penicillium arizonense]OGE54602.1 hypothetical protein PENARI_c006G01939 [Penicillium arizonense]